MNLKNQIIMLILFVIIITTIAIALNINLTNPTNLSTINETQIIFTYSIDTIADNCTLYTNETTWSAKDTKTNTQIGENNFTQTINTEGKYLWNVQCTNSTNTFWAINNNTFTLDLNAPTITLINPENNFKTTENEIEFEYYVSDIGGVNSCALIIDSQINQTSNTITNNANNYFTANLKTGQYAWAIRCTDTFLQEQTTNTRNVEIDSKLEWNTTNLNLGDAPSNNEEITKLTELRAINENNQITLTCTGNCAEITHGFITQSAENTDIFIEFACSSNTPNNYTATFNATSNEHVEGTLLTVECEIFQARPDLMLNNSLIYYEGELVEGQEIILKADVMNTGDVNANNVNTSFFLKNELIGYEIKNVDADTNITFQTTYEVGVGDVSIDVKTDNQNKISEYLEDNNNATLNISVGSWQKLTGNISGRFVLQDASNNTVFLWEKELLDESNLFVVDADSSINWNELIALTKDTNNNTRMQDLEIADQLLNTTSNSDSMNKTFAENFQTTTFNVFGQEINHVPIFYTTPGEFKTGILWDTTRDTNGYYDSADREDLVFITQIKQETLTDIGIFDYEIEFVASLREYAQEQTQNRVSIYVELK
ncbi:MAG: CARDB domain-containing protein [Candidatus Woesearchaeota archaeon]